MNSAASGHSSVIAVRWDSLGLEGAAGEFLDYLTFLRTEVGSMIIATLTQYAAVKLNK